MSPIAYDPIFKGELGEDLSKRWQTIRLFLDRWCMPITEPLADRSQDNTPLIAKAETLHGRVSPSIRQWLSLAEEAAHRRTPVIRDCLMVEPLENHVESEKARNATIILMQGEGDLFWTVANSRFAEEDPPVDVYQIFDEESPSFFCRYASVSEFALAYLCTYNSFACHVTEAFTAHATPQQLEEVQSWFDHALTLKSVEGRTHRFLMILEKQNVVALVNNSNRIEVSLFCEPSSLQLPSFLLSALEECVQTRRAFRAKLERP